MADVSEKIVENLRYLRRYARALVGSQQTGDTYVRICLEALLQEPERVTATGDVRLQLFHLFHDVWTRTSASDEAPDGSEPHDLSVEARLQALPVSERQMLLLTTLEGFSVQDAAQILGLSHEEGADLLASAWSSVNEQMATSILVIEDEPVIALDIVGLVRDMGHSVIGIASSQIEAVRLAQKSQPGLVLADIDLGPGGSGLTAVKEILDSMRVPVIFVTAYPERLLTGERPEPTYLVTKPFEPDTLKVTISQALSFFGQPRQSKQAV
jgi:CheY-like chemotaxis protein/DNA-directed RNA polymerase specialized sigma24 family protein